MVVPLQHHYYIDSDMTPTITTLYVSVHISMQYTGSNLLGYGV
jgi:hypothetical protein